MHCQMSPCEQNENCIIGLKKETLRSKIELTNNIIKKREKKGILCSKNPKLVDAMKVVIEKNGTHTTIKLQQ